MVQSQLSRLLKYSVRFSRLYAELTVNCTKVTLTEMKPIRNEGSHISTLSRENYKEVLQGRYSYPELMALVADLRAELARAETASTLPAEPDGAAIEQMVIELHRRALGDARFADA